MSEKTDAKSRKLARADLNFISQKPLEIIVEAIESLKRSNVASRVLWTTENTALFQLTYTRDDQPTAEVTGRLQRWAGDMTHIYCDGRAFRTPKSYVSSMVRWAVVGSLIAPFITCPLAIMASPASESFFTGLFILSMWTFMLAGIGLSGWWFIHHTMRILHIHNPRQSMSTSAKKDRERLLHFLTEIIRDDDFEYKMQSHTSEQGKPLSDEEIAAIIEQAEMMARLKK